MSFSKRKQYLSKINNRRKKTRKKVGRSSRRSSKMLNNKNRNLRLKSQKRRRKRRKYNKRGGADFSILQTISSGMRPINLESLIERCNIILSNSNNLNLDDSKKKKIKLLYKFLKKKLKNNDLDEDNLSLINNYLSVSENNKYDEDLEKEVINLMIKEEKATNANELKKKCISLLHNYHNLELKNEVIKEILYLLKFLDLIIKRGDIETSSKTFDNKDLNEDELNLINEYLFSIKNNLDNQTDLKTKVANLQENREFFTNLKIVNKDDLISRCLTILEQNENENIKTLHTFLTFKKGSNGNNLDIDNSDLNEYELYLIDKYLLSIEKSEDSKIIQNLYNKVNKIMENNGLFLGFTELSNSSSDEEYDGFDGL